MAVDHKDSVFLLLDTCGDRGSIALTRGESVLHEAPLPERMASATILPAVREALRTAQVNLHDLTGVGVVNGPGSFTGLRVGLAVAKGLCEAQKLPLAAVSRLAVLAHASGMQNGFCALYAGREQVYVCKVCEGVCAVETLAGTAELARISDGSDVVFAEKLLLPTLQVAVGRARYLELAAKDALPLVQRRLANGGSDSSAVDANYVRDERAIYAHPRTQG